MNAQQPYSVLHAEPPGSRSIGAILVEAGVLSIDDLDRIARLQQEQNLRFGDAAVLLGLLSEDQLRFALSKQFNYAYLLQDGDKPISGELISAYQPFCPQAEQLRALRSQISNRWFDRNAGQNALAVVGYERGVGRSYLAANLAIAFAQLGERTLLIDADMRNPRQHELFKLENRQGLSMLLSGRSEQDNVQHIEGLEHLAVLPAGPIPPNPQELLNKPMLKVALDTLSERFDIVLIDTAAMATARDAQIVAHRAGAAVVVARKDQSQLAMFAEMANGLSQSGIAVIGSVFNVPPTTPHG